MKSSSSCAVEISITAMDGEETVEPVPECLQGAVLATPGDSGSEPQELVKLPLRFTQMINCTDCDKQRLGDNLSDREKDIHTALKWIRQEIVSIAIVRKSLQTFLTLHRVNKKCHRL